MIETGLKQIYICTDLYIFVLTSSSTFSVIREDAPNPERSDFLVFVFLFFFVSGGSGIHCNQRCKGLISHGIKFYQETPPSRQYKTATILAHMIGKDERWHPPDNIKWPASHHNPHLGTKVSTLYDTVQYNS